MTRPQFLLDLETGRLQSSAVLFGGFRSKVVLLFLLKDMAAAGVWRGKPPCRGARKHCKAAETAGPCLQEGILVRDARLVLKVEGFAIDLGQTRRP